MPITTEYYGKLPGGEEVLRYSLANNQGVSLKAINYGGIITELHVPDRHGDTEDIVLGLGSLEEYLAGHPYFGAIVGRVAGRITGARFAVEGNVYHLACNDPPNHLHGGDTGFDKQFWSADCAEADEGEPCVAFSYDSPDGEESYPGNAAAEVSYTLTRQNTLRIDYVATTDRATPLSLTNHSYFNLAGEGSGVISNHLLLIHSDQYVPADPDLTLTGRIESVTGKAIDFTRSRPVGDIIGEPLHIHGDNYIIKQRKSQDLAPVAAVVEPDSGRKLDVYSSAASLQFYTGKFLADSRLKGKSGKIYGAHGGFCLECHGYPDGVNAPEIEDIILQPEDTYRQTTEYRFSVD